METTEFLITKKETSTRVCNYCKGVGKLERLMHGQKYTTNCSMCSGTGKRKTDVRSEVLLTEALKSLNLL
jgi:DnaJ-class molecular chaperone